MLDGNELKCNKFALDDNDDDALRERGIEINH